MSSSPRKRLESGDAVIWLGREHSISKNIHYYKAIIIKCVHKKQRTMINGLDQRERHHQKKNLIKRTVASREEGRCVGCTGNKISFTRNRTNNRISRKKQATQDHVSTWNSLPFLQGNRSVRPNPTVCWNCPIQRNHSQHETTAATEYRSHLQNDHDK